MRAALLSKPFGAETGIYAIINTTYLQRTTWGLFIAFTGEIKY